MHRHLHHAFPFSTYDSVVSGGAVVEHDARAYPVVQVYGCRDTLATNKNSNL